MTPAEKKRQYNRAYYRKNAERLRADKNRYYAENSDVLKARVQLWREGNPEKVLQTNRNWHAANPGYAQISSQLWREQNPDKRRQNEKNYRDRNPEKQKAKGASRRAVVGVLSAQEIRQIMSNPCAYCGAPPAHLEHCTPLFRGGYNDFDNCVSACARCNTVKGKKTVLEFLKLWPKAVSS
jgi:5-methylcytosine-specific restriction endonuclease McrA